MRSVKGPLRGNLCNDSLSASALYYYFTQGVIVAMMQCYAVLTVVVIAVQ